MSVRTSSSTARARRAARRSVPRRARTADSRAPPTTRQYHCAAQCSVRPPSSSSTRCPSGSTRASAARRRAAPLRRATRVALRHQLDERARHNRCGQIVPTQMLLLDETGAREAEPMQRGADNGEHAGARQMSAARATHPQRPAQSRPQSQMRPAPHRAPANTRATDTRQQRSHHRCNT
jgi:hypothetical protein